MKRGTFTYIFPQEAISPLPYIYILKASPREEQLKPSGILPGAEN